MNRFLRPFPLALLVALLLTVSACDSNEPGDGGGGGEVEVITNVELTLTPQGGGTAVTAEATFNEASVQQSIGTLNLQAGTVYTGSIDLRNESAADPDEQSITNEIREENDVHQFFYQGEGGAAGRITVSDRNADDNGAPLGLTFTATVTDGPAASGTLRVKLRHYETDAPNKLGDSISAPEVAGVVENDVNIAFPVQISG